jgi:hypothetical protein
VGRVGAKLDGAEPREPSETSLAGPDSRPGAEAVKGGAQPEAANAVGGAAPVGSELIRVGQAAHRPERVDPNGDRPELGPDGRGNALVEGAGNPPGAGGDVRESNPPTNPQRRRAVAEVTDLQTRCKLAITATK